MKLFRYHGMHTTPYWKRSVDLLIAVSALVFLSPLLLLIAACLRVTLGSPVLFRQIRPGLRGVPFTIYKFRTMTDEIALRDARRITKLGSFLRKTSVDELPELWNVVRGEMSLVGPRPLLMQYLNRYSPEQRRRHNVLPGITGWAQVNGRNATTWEHRFTFDLWYVEHQSFWLDVKILFLTILRVLRRDGINQEGCATMTEFMGSEANEVRS